MLPFGKKCDTSIGFMKLKSKTGENKKAPTLETTEFWGFLELILAATYVPTHLRVQYHRPCEA